MSQRRVNLRSKLLRVGPDALSDEELLEMILFLSQPRLDVKKDAKRLLTYFGSFIGAVTARHDTVCNLSDICESGAFALKVVQVAAERLKGPEIHIGPFLSSRDAVKEYLAPRSQVARKEMSRVLFFNNRYRLLADEAQSERGQEEWTFNSSQVLRRALQLQSTGLILVHVNPKCSPTLDVRHSQIVTQLAKSANDLAIYLLDYIIINNEQYLSYQEEGVLR